MGMYDNIICEYPLPIKKIQKEVFQTKDFKNVLDVYKITKKGRLLRENCKHEIVPEAERPYYGRPEWDNSKLAQLMGSIKRIGLDWEDIDFHGIIEFHTILRNVNDPDQYITYTAKFTDGTLDTITEDIKGM